MKNNEKKVIFYKNYNQDVVENKNQNYKIKSNYKWIHNNIFYKIFSNIIYRIASIFGFFYCRFKLKIKIENKKIIKKYKKSGFFLFANHTQSIGDVFIPNEICRPKRTYIVVSQANLGLPVIGKLLPILGALPISDNISGTKKLFEAIKKRCEQHKCIIIYPEAHVWPYYTKIRDFEKTSFKFPVEFDKPSFCITTTYQDIGKKKPEIRIYIDGPFFPDKKLNKKEQVIKLHDEIYNKMNERAKNSNFEYIKYKKIEN